MARARIWMGSAPACIAAPVVCQVPATLMETLSRPAITSQAHTAATSRPTMDQAPLTGQASPETHTEADQTLMGRVHLTSQAVDIATSKEAALELPDYQAPAEAE